MAPRIRRPKDKAELLERLVADGGNPFSYLYEVLTFSAALGYSRDRRRPFDKADEPIRWEQFQSHIDGADALVDMLAAASTDAADILGDKREEERFRVFEEYANGGLEVLAEELEASPAKSTRE